MPSAELRKNTVKNVRPKKSTASQEVKLTDKTTNNITVTKSRSSRHKNITQSLKEKLKNEITIPWQISKSAHRSCGSQGASSLFLRPKEKGRIYHKILKEAGEDTEEDTKEIHQNSLERPEE
jgi:hypothetical protein